MLLRICLAITLLVPASCLLGQETTKNILMIAGRPSHGFGAHEHYAGLRILQESIEASTDAAVCKVIKGWPQDATLIDNADTIVIYSDGGGGHPAIAHLDQLRAQLAKGCGFVCIHYAVEMVPGPPGDAMVDLLGGHFEVNWSVNPHWVGEFTSLPDHPITRGVKPFATNDEWYFHLRFKDSDKVTPILSAVAPPETMRRPDGPHSGNPAVRQSVAAGEKQTVAWAYERPAGGRSFGITGGHFHWNWGHDDMRRLVTNAIRWTAGEEISEQGSSLGQPVNMDDLLENQDYPKPRDFDLDQTKAEFNLQSMNSANPQDSDPQNSDPQNSDPRDAGQATAGLEVAEGLQVTLAASEPNLKSLSNLDIDDRGRVWVMEVMNYGPNYHGIRPEGDRIVICEDTTGDGVMDSFKTYYQGTEIDSAMGICVLGNEVIVTASPNVYRFTDTDGDDKPDKQELLFSEVGVHKHDHSGHSFSFGPDGKLYWNFGNAGQQVKTAAGETVVDIHGRPVVDNGKPFHGGMPFRCDLDGSNFEVLAHNFRNNWEVAVDSFGTLWQSDNDDDGNRGTRINFVMQHGNYGYLDERTAAGWNTPRINMEPEIPRRHWHLNDPGVVPNLLHTGAGSPAGICVYEGRLLPQRFWDQVIHCDPGTNVVRAYPVSSAGAGYTATIDPLVTGTGDNWFRPIDVSVAPDGSLFVTDWYDPGVGGHQYQDRDRGRLFRIAPPGTKYQVPKFDYATAAGAADALRNPNLAVRYKAWTALHQLGAEAESELQKLAADPNPRMRARALWLLGKIPGRGEDTVAQAIRDDYPEVRIMGIRLATQLGLNPAVACAALATDHAASVRRELAVALRFDSSPSMPGVWAQLASAYDGQDRWYLEALGIGSDLRASECYDAWIAAVDGVWDTPAGHDIAWRVRAPQAAETMAAILAKTEPSAAQTDRYFRSLQYHADSVRQSALKPLLALDERFDRTVVQAIQQIGALDDADRQQVQPAIERYLARCQGTQEWIDLATKFQPAGMETELQRLLIAPDTPDQIRVRAADLLLNTPEGNQQVRQMFAQQSLDEVASVAGALGMLANINAKDVLAEVVVDASRPFDVRRHVVVAMAGNQFLSKILLRIADANQLPADTRILCGGLLSRSPHADIRDHAAKIFPQPQHKDQQPLPPLDELAQRKGDPHNGAKLFSSVATCGNCHPVAGQGKQVGPDLSEIGSKLSREAMLTSILDPSAGISHNYETYVVLTADGQVINGLLISDSVDQVVIRTPEAIDRTIDRADIESMKKSDKSLMPENLHQTIDQQGLIDIVEYMTTLKKAGI
jgi:putative membrane-bound dehydrogenase-like protein